MKNLFLILAAFFIFSYEGCSKFAENSKETKSAEYGEGNYPKRIVCLSPASTEIIFAINAQENLVAVSDYSDFPEEAKKLPKVGGFDGKTLSIEKILSFNPDFVYLTKGMHDFLVPQLEKLKIPHYISDGSSIQSLKNEISEISKITGKSENGKKVIFQMEQDFEEAKNILKSSILNSKNTKAPKIYWEVWHTPFISAGKQSFINDFFDFLNFKNIFSDIEQPYPQISEESIISRNPDIILVPDTNGISCNSIRNRNGWQNINAIQQNKIFAVDGNIFSRPGPRLGQSAIALCKLISKSNEE